MSERPRVYDDDADDIGLPAALALLVVLAALAAAGWWLGSVLVDWLLLAHGGR